MKTAFNEACSDKHDREIDGNCGNSQLSLNGFEPLDARPRRAFLSEQANPDWIDFADIADGVGKRKRLGGFDLRRV